MRVVRKNNLQKVAGSRNMNIPTSTAPTAPIPVHTGYAIPNGIVCVALARNKALSTYRTANAEIQVNHSVPVTPFVRPRQYVKPTSHSPAIINIIQFIFVSRFKIQDSSFKFHVFVFVYLTLAYSHTSPSLSHRSFASVSLANHQGQYLD